MTKTEAAEILANFITVRARKRGLSLIDATVIAECISEARYQTIEGSLLHTAAWLRPADRTIRAAAKRS
jgi:hypothetical protein